MNLLVGPQLAHIRRILLGPELDGVLTLENQGLFFSGSGYFVSGPTERSFRGVGIILKGSPRESPVRLFALPAK